MRGKLPCSAGSGPIVNPPAGFDSRSLALSRYP